MRFQRMKSFAAAFGAVVAGFIGSSCAPADFDDGIRWTVDRYRTADASARIVEGMPCLRVNDFELDRLRSIADARPTRDDDAVSQAYVEILGACHDLAVKCAAREIDHLPDQAIIEAVNRYFPADSNAVEPRRLVRERYLAQLDQQYNAVLIEAGNASPGQVRTSAGRILARVGPSVKDQHGGGLLLGMVKQQYDRPAATIDAIPGPFIVYEPDSNPAIEDSPSGIGAEEQALLRRFAPILYQQRNAKTPYAPQLDLIGTVTLSGSPSQINVGVKTSEPRLYCYTRRTLVHDREHVQLVYCWWFPEHPAMSPGDPEAGNVDGATVRITLDASGVPALVEAIQNCGCHIRCFASTALEQAERRSGVTAPTADGFAIAKSKSESPRVEVVGLFDPPVSASGARLVVISRAGYHDVAAVLGPNSPALEGRRVQTRRTYELTAYDSLENLPTSFGRASMFGPDGLVHNAGRAEGWLLAGTGMRSAGQPRQRGTQLVCWDAVDFDDPHLLEKVLRLPDEF